jgi:hypothetical protein
LSHTELTEFTEKSRRLISRPLSLEAAEGAEEKPQKEKERARA